MQPTKKDITDDALVFWFVQEIPSHRVDWIEAASLDEAKERAFAIGIDLSAREVTNSGWEFRQLNRGSFTIDDNDNATVKLHLDNGKVFYYMT